MPRHPLRSHLHAHSLLEGHAHVDLPSLPLLTPFMGSPHHPTARLLLYPASRASWTWCMWSASPTHWWRWTRCPGFRRSASTKVRWGAAAECQHISRYRRSLTAPASPLAKVACVKSRDMHWALVAHRDQRDINLSSLRMLIVADGANPCKWRTRRVGGASFPGLWFPLF